ncbi:MAG: hypothetical protein M3P41_16555 [Actinomycetota bacterium]|nr:hypothetical protein [Actinomycetota bacterium]
MRLPSFERFGLVPVVLWLALGAGLAAFTSRVTDWFVMTDELLYERLALSVIRLHSPLPHVHDQFVPSINQLYPLILATVLGTGNVAQGLHRAHVLNAFVMASAAVPAYLLARRVAGPRWAASLAAVLSVAVPWIVLSSFLLTEVAAYPAFLWALLAFQAATATPSARNDLLAAAGLVLAVVARTQLGVLALVLPVAVVLDARGGRAALRAHRVLAAAYAAGFVVALALVASGRSVLGTYSATAHGNPLPLRIVPALGEHLAAIGLGLGILPFLVGGAWLASNAVASATRERRIFALLASLATVVLTIEVASYDLRFAGGIVRDRYLFYVAPLIIVAFTAALASGRWPRRSLAVPLAVLVYGFAESSLPVFEKLNVDTPVAILDNYLGSSLGGLTAERSFLVAAAALGTLLVLEGTVLLRHAYLAALLAGFALVVLPAETGYAFQRLFRVDGTAGRPLSSPGSSEFEWVDRTVGRAAHVTAVPYPMLPGDYWAGVAYWWDLEFWNESVDRSAGVPHHFEWTPSTFPKLDLRFDRRGRANVSPSVYVAQSVGDARFHIVGNVVINDRGLFLVEPEQPWRADWVSRGLYDDGWTKPGVSARIRVFSYPGQNRGVMRSLTVYLLAPSGIAARPFSLESNVQDVDGTVGSGEVSADVSLCVPRNGFSEIRLSSPDASPIYGDPTSEVTIGSGRAAGVLVTRIYLSGQIGADCRA